MMQQQDTAAPQTTPPAPQATQPAAPEATPPAAPLEPQPATLHDFTLDLLSNPAAREAFQLDPEGVLSACGLSDITAGDIQDVLPLVLDTASIANVDVVDQVLAGTGDLPAIDQLTAIAGNAGGVSAITDVVPATSALAGDFSDLGDVSKVLDTNVLTTGTDVVSNVSGLAHDNAVVTKVTDVADVKDVSDVLVKNIDTDLVGTDLVDTNALVKDVADLDVTNVVDVTESVAHNVAPVTDVHDNLSHVVGDVVKIGDIEALDGGVGNLNDLNLFHH